MSVVAAADAGIADDTRDLDGRRRLRNGERDRAVSSGTA